MKAYVYETTNIINGIKYIGCHKCDHFDETYKGSGKYLLLDIEKYGWDNFTCSIIKDFDNVDEAYQYEYDLIKELDAVHSDSYYNKMHGGGGRWEHNGVPLRKGATFTQEHRKKLSDSHKDIPFSFSRRQSMSVAQSGRVFGGFSESTIKTLSNKRKRHRVIHKGLLEFKVDVDELNDYLNDGWLEGSSNTVWMHKGLDSYRVHREDIDEKVSNGYIKGRAKNNHRYWITDGKISRRVYGDTLKFYQNSGFSRVDGLSELFE